MASKEDEHAIPLVQGVPPAAGVMVPDDNISRILRARPGEVVRLAPSGIDTGHLLMLDRCPHCDRPHFHMRGTQECLGKLLEHPRPGDDPLPR